MGQTWVKEFEGRGINMDNLQYWHKLISIWEISRGPYC